MAVFVWQGKTAAGLTQSGEIDVPNQQEAVQQLRRKRIVISQIKQKKTRPTFSLASLRGSTVKGSDLAIFARQFATMIDAGLPLVQCLDILTKQTQNKELANIIGQVQRDVEGGNTLAESMGHHTNAFDSLFVNMVEAGEAGGILDIILDRLATYTEKSVALKRKVKSALTYPAVVFSVAIGATVFMLLFIIPTFAKVFTEFGGKLPAPTQVVISMSNFLKGYWWLLLAMIAGVIFGFKRTYKIPAGRLRIDTILLKLPIFGSLLIKASVARFTRTLGTMISSGVPILTALDITARTAGNMLVEKTILATRGSIREGETIAQPLRQSKIFPPMVVQMIAVGEETGALDDMLRKIADFYDEEVNTAVDTLTSIIEPIMIVFMGLVVGGMVVAMYMPMFKLANVVTGGH
ncbi:MAG: type II secretion system F family protein [Candidatus Eisenbacteria bacterium]|uniref:Type II secretion system F family protein n=1 Tax=Eiseniibacteriota bacterium TaxID=2212470 RepID=A0A948RXN2_UNCEI|nr:type II secretion system F family protein [Candidatus Eisenbacteria bacterium]MBU1948007.1 type II secretion system F family protein [Candidatus Eisenbacteria bacterium]MBU2691438.1 type II secretion system F family protein [Candidatus Eisenbacteria bacterium]